MSLKEWLVCHLPAWLLPMSSWGAKGRPDMPDKHAVVNKQQELSLRIDRLGQRAQRETEERRHYRDWDEHYGG